MSPLLELRGLSAHIGKRRVIEHVDLAVRSGELLGLLGPNGSGKSTLLAVIAGLRGVSSGELLLDGGRLDPSAVAWRRRIAFVFQSPAIDRKLTVAQNLELAAAMHGMGGSGRREAVRTALESAQLTDRSEDAAQTLSGGLLRRLDVSRALIAEPEVVLLDEPTSGLDEASFRELWERLDRYRRARGATMLLATHRGDEAERCDRVATLREGRVVRVATPAELIGEIADDRVQIELREPIDAPRTLARWWSDGATQHGRHIELRVADAAHEVPALLGVLGTSDVISLSIRRPSMADAFARVTGSRLEEA